MIELKSIEAELKILGYLLNHLVPAEKKLNALQVLTPEYFDDDDHRKLFKYIKQFSIYDPIVLWDKISHEKDIKSSGITKESIMEIDTFISEKEIESYINIITDKFQKRLIYHFADEIKSSIVSGEDQFTVALKAQQVLGSMSTRSKIETNQELLDKVLNERPGDVLSTGYKLIDKFIGGYARGMIITIAGDSGHLKTTLALDAAFRMAENNPSIKVGIFSKEMLATELLKKQIARICGIPTSKIFGQDYDKEYVKKKMMEVEPWRENRIKIINPNSFSGVADIARIQMTHRFDVWFLDFIQMLEFARSATSSSDYNIQIGQNMRNLQSLSLATKSVGIILSQVKKGIEYRKSKKPTISDIEWSGLIKQLSSYIFFSYYPGKYYGFDVLPEDNYFLLGEKTRFAETFVFPMKADAALGKFEEINDPEERQKLVSKLKAVVD